MARLRAEGDIKVTARHPLIGLVPARGGSKGIKGKNLQPVCGQPLLVHAIRLCQQVCGRVIVSTDDPAISAVAYFAGAELVGRPDRLAGDDASVDEVCAWLQTVIPEQARLLVVQPTVPQVRVDDLRRLTQMPGDAVCAAVEDRHIVWHDGRPLTGRGNRQQDMAWPLREIGVRLYQPGHWGEPPSSCVRFAGPIVDIDTPSDLAAVRTMMERRRIVFRVIGNRQKGSGHLHRCLALAERMQHHEVGFVPVQSDGLAEQLIRKHGWPVWSEAGPGADLIVNDTLDTTAQGMARLRAVAPVITLEDLGDGAALADRCVNDMYGDREGPAWAVVRPEFLAVPDSQFDRGRVLITFGGTDPAGLTQRVAPLLDDLAVRVVEPPGRSGEWRNLAEDMAWADLVVTSGGRTVWEATAARRPCVTVLQNAREASHQHLRVESGVVNLGLAGLVDDGAVAGTVRRLLSDPQTLADLASRMRGVVDGRGADRLVMECERVLGGL